MPDLPQLNQPPDQQMGGMPHVLQDLFRTDPNSPEGALKKAALAYTPPKGTSFLPPPPTGASSIEMRPDATGTYQADTTPSSISGISPTPSGSPGTDLSGNLPGAAGGPGASPSFMDRITPLFKPPAGEVATPMERMTSAFGTAAHALSPNTWGGRMGEGAVMLNQQEQQNRMLAKKYGLETAQLGLHTAETMSKLRAAGRLEEPAPSSLMKKWGLDPNMPMTMGQAHGLAPAFRQPAGAGATSDIGKLIRERDALALDDPNRAAYDAEIKKKSEPTAKEPDNDFKTFKAGMPQQKGESVDAWNARVSKEWHKQKVAEAVKVSVSGAAERGKAYANERFYSMFDTTAGKTIKVKGYALNNDTNNRYIDPSDPTLKADTQSLEKMTKGMDSIAAFEKGATQSLDYAQSVAKDYGLGKYPRVNKVSQLWSYETGDPKVKGLKNSLTTAATEYMKVINAGSDLTAAELTVMGQQRAKEIIESADNFESITNSIKIMKREMQISGDKFKAQRREIQGRLKSYSGKSETQGGSLNLDMDAIDAELAKRGGK